MLMHVDLDVDIDADIDIDTDIDIANIKSTASGGISCTGLILSEEQFNFLHVYTGEYVAVSVN